MTMHPASLARRPACAAVLATTLLAAGCGHVTKLNLDDTSAPLVAARVLHRVGGGPGGGGIELEASRVRGQGTQQLDAFDLATLGSQSIAGPVRLEHRAQLQQVQLVYNHLLFAGRPVEMEWFAGAAWVRTTWDSVSANPADPRLSTRATWYGPTGGVVGRVRLGPVLALEGRVGGAVDVSDRIERGTRQMAELALALRPLPALVLRGGVSEVRSTLRAEAGSTELTLRLRGPFVNLGLEF